MKRQLITTMDAWAVEARILLASLVLSEPVITARQSESIGLLLKSATWIDAFSSGSPWVKDVKRQTKRKRRQR